MICAAIGLTTDLLDNGGFAMAAQK